MPSLAPETCLELSAYANLIQDSIRQAKAENPLVLRARPQAWPRYWRSLAWWQGPRCNGPLTPLGRFLNRSSRGRTESQFPLRRAGMTIDTKLWQNRKQRKELARRLRSEDPSLGVVHPHAAGVDVGNSAHYVAVRPDRDPEPVRRFECFTADLHRLADWLQSCGVKTVALQSTGVYWIPLYDILEERGFEVYLVNARHTKNLPGRKSDVQESQWLLKLHTYGLLNHSFRPTSEIRVLRTYWRQRAEHVEGAATCIRRMQKALTQMNLQLADVINPAAKPDYLGAQYRRLRSKLGAPKAITAMTHRLARLVYRMLKYGQQYVDKGAAYYEQRNRHQQIQFLRKKAAQFGLQVTAAHP